MTVYTVFADTNDHHVICTNATYATARSGAGTKTDYTTNITAPMPQVLSAGVYYCSEYFLSFDTSVIPAGTPAAVFLDVFLAATQTAATQVIDFAEFAWSGGTADYIAGASLSASPQFSRSFSNGEAAGYKTTTTNPANVARSATYKLVGYARFLRTGSAPTDATDLTLYTANQSGTANDPRLRVGISTPYTLAMDAGAFSLAGQAANLRHGRVNKANVGTFAMTGRDALLNSIRAFRADRGSFAFTGMDAGLRADRIVLAAAGAFALIGKAAALGIKRLPPIARTLVLPRSTLGNGRTLEL